MPKPRFSILTSIALAGLAALLPTVTTAQTFHPPIIQRLINAAILYGPFSGFEDTQPGAGLRRAARIIGLFIGALLTFIGIVFMVLMIQAGLRWMTARGNEQDVEHAKETIKNAAVGLLVVALAYAFVTLVSAVIVRTGLLQG